MSFGYVFRIAILPPKPRGFDFNADLKSPPCRSGHPLGRARSVLAVTEAGQRRANRVEMSALASRRPHLSAREKTTENGSLQLEICYPAGPPDWALGRVKNRIRARTGVVNDRN